MSGYVTAVDVACEVRFCATGEVVSGVDSRLLQQVQPLRQGSYVVRGQWVGKVDEAFDHITLRMSEGSVCRIANADDDMLTPLEEQGFNDDTPYYPGLRVKANQGTLMRAKWLKGGPKSGIREGVVLSIEPGRTVVHWMAANQLESADAPQPMHVVDGRKLQILDSFVHTWWQLGDMALYDKQLAHEEAEAGLQGASGGRWKRSETRPQAGCASAQATLATTVPPAAAEASAADESGLREWTARGRRTRHGRVQTASALMRNKAGKVLKGVIKDDVDKCVEILSTCSSVEVAWQDGTVESGVKTIDLVPVKHMGAHDFYPDEYVLEKMDDDPMDLPNPTIDAASAVAAAAKLDELMRQQTAQAFQGAANPWAQDEGETGGGVSAGAARVEMQLLNGYKIDFPERLIPTLQQAKEQMRSEMASFLPAADSAHFDQLVANGKLAETLQFVTSHPQTYAVVQRMLRSSQWQELLRDGTIEGLAQGIFSQAGVSGAQRRHRFGVLKTIDPQERVVKVEWIGLCNFDGSREVVGEDATKEITDESGTAQKTSLGVEELSCYDVLEHPEYSYRIADVVVRLRTKDVSWGRTFMREGRQDDNEACDAHEVDDDDADSDGWETTSEHTDLGEEDTSDTELKDHDNSGDEKDQQQEDSDDDAKQEGQEPGVHDDEEYLEEEETNKSRSGAAENTEESKQSIETTKRKQGKSKSMQPWVGELLALKGGRLQVRWMTGSITWVWPCEVFVVSSPDGHWDDGEHLNTDGSDWETVGSAEDPGALPNEDGLDASDVMSQLDRLNALAGSLHEHEADHGSSDTQSLDDASVDEDRDSRIVDVTNRPQLTAEGVPDEQGPAEGGTWGQGGARFHAASSIKNVWSALSSLVFGSAVASHQTGVEGCVHDVSALATVAQCENHDQVAASAREKAEPMQVDEFPLAQETLLQAQRLREGADDALSVAAQADQEVHASSSEQDALEEDRSGAGQIGSEAKDAARKVAPQCSDVSASNAEPGAASGASGRWEEAKVATECESDEGVPFLVVEKLPGHKLDMAGGAAATAPSRAFVKAVRKEWKQLRSGLPEGIKVLVSEQRMDLMRAVIFGPAKTPYEDGVFVFDIYFPPEYPAAVPQVLFISYGDRLNPNLYENGKVCLSLLGTWAGEGVETWNPATSTILQVLVSIQGLVLVADPYYNEAGYEKQMGTLEGRHNSKQYNESTLLLVLKHMIYTLAHPTPPLESLITDQFRKRGASIIRRCERILEMAASSAADTTGSGGVATGVGAHGGVQEEEEEAGKPCGWADKSVPETASKGFILSLHKLLPRLKAALGHPK